MSTYNLLEKLTRKIVFLKTEIEGTIHFGNIDGDLLLSSDSEVTFSFRRIFEPKDYNIIQELMTWNGAERLIVAPNEPIFGIDNFLVTSMEFNLEVMSCPIFVARLTSVR